MSFDITNIERKEVRILTGRRLIDNNIVPILPNIIGRENAITQGQLVDKCFGKGFSKLQRMMLRGILHQALTHIRGSDDYKCFIMGYLDNIQGYMYFIPTTIEDVEEYKDRAESRIRGIRAMVKRCERSVQEGWYKKVGVNRFLE